jgi:PKD repeat protein
VSFGSAAEALRGWGGSAGNFGLAANGSLSALPGVFVTITMPAGTKAGLPNWLPVSLTKAGLRFYGGDQSVNLRENNTLGEPIQITNPLDFSLIVSGGLARQDPWPIEATVADLEINLDDLAHGLFPFRNLSGVSLGMTPFELAPGFRIGGGLAFGAVDPDDNPATSNSIFYARVFGEFEYNGLGAGIDLVIAETGPVLARILAPLGIPLGPTSLILTSVQGTIVFGGPVVPRVNDPMELLGNSPVFTYLDLTDAQIRQSLIDAGGEPTWTKSFSIGLSGSITTVASPGILNGQVTIGANIGLQGPEAGLALLGSGQLTLAGLPLGQAALMLNLRDPLSPKLDFAFAAPAPGNPLGFLLPAQTTFTIHLDPSGVISAPVVGLRTFVSSMAEELLGRIASALEADHQRQLAQLVLDADANGTLSAAESAVQITRAYLRQRLLGEVGPALLPATFAGITAQSARVANAFLMEYFNAASGLPRTIQEVRELNRQALEARINELREAMSSFAQSALTAALNAGFVTWEGFNPTLAIRGAIQPTVLGFPMGQPTDSVTIALNKHFVSFELSASLKETLKRSVNLVSGGLGGILVDAMTLGFTDHLRFKYSAEFKGVKIIEALISGHADGLGLTQMLIDALNPMTGWSVAVGGSLDFMGFEIADISGFMFAPNSSLLQLNAPGLSAVQLLDTNGDDKPDIAPAANTSLVPIAKRSQYDAMVRFGGILLTGQLKLPKVLRDPVGTFASINWNLPSQITQYPDYVQRIIDALTANEEWARLQLYIPSPASLLDLNYLTYDSEDNVGEPFTDSNGNGRRDANESFTDRGNGVWDPGERLTTDRNGNGQFDPTEPFEDLNHNGVHDASEPYRDLNGDGLYTESDVFVDVGNGVYDGPSSNARISFKRAAANFESELRAMFNSAFLAGYVDVQLFSLRLGKAYVSATPNGLRIETDVPLLAGLRTSYEIGFRNLDAGKLVKDLLSSPLLKIVGRQVTFPANLTLPVKNFPFPIARFTGELGTANVDAWLQQNFGLPQGIFRRTGTTANVRFEVFSIGYGDENARGVERNGGFRLTLQAGLPGLIRDCEFTIEAEFFNCASLTQLAFPNFTASARVADFAGGTGLDSPPDLIDLLAPADGKPMIELSKETTAAGAKLSGWLRGQVKILNVLTLRADGGFVINTATGDNFGLYGQLRLNGGASATLSGTGSPGFDLSGQFALQINTTAKPQLAPDDPLVSLPRGLQLKIAGNLAFAGSFALAGAFALKSGQIQVGTQTKSGLLIAAQATLDVKAGTATLLSLAANGALQVTTDGVAARIQLGQETNQTTQPAKTLAQVLNGTGFTLSAKFNLELNTTGQATAIDGIEAGRYLRIRAGSTTEPVVLTFQVAGYEVFRLRGYFEFTMASGALTLKSWASLDLRTFGTYATDSSAYLTIAADGIAGRLTLRVSTAASGFFTFSAGTYSLAINTKSPARTVDGIAPGVRFEISSLTLGVAGLSLKGSLAGGYDSAGGFYYLEVLATDKLRLEAPAYQWVGVTPTFSGRIQTDGQVDLTFSTPFSFGDRSIFSLSGSVAFQVKTEMGQAKFGASLSGSMYVLGHPVLEVTSKLRTTGELIASVHYQISTWAGNVDVRTTIYVDLKRSIFDQNIFDPNNIGSDPTPPRRVTAIFEPVAVQDWTVAQEGLSREVGGELTALRLNVLEGPAGQTVNASVRITVFGLRTGERLNLQYALTSYLPSDLAALPEAGNGGDFLANTSGTLAMIGTGQEAVTAEFPITVKGDNEPEPDVQFAFNFSVPWAAQDYTFLQVQRVRVIIRNDDPERPADAVVFYDFDNPATDASGGYTFTPEPSLPVDAYLEVTPFASSMSRIANYALRFDGVNDFVSGTAAARLPADSFSFEFWLRPLSVTGYDHVIGLGGEHQATVYLSGNGEIAFKFADLGGKRVETSFGKCAVNVWNHVAITYDGSRVRSYVNGVAAATVAATGVVRYRDDSVVLGGVKAADGTVSPTFHGELDELRLWDRPLTKEEIIKNLSRTLLGSEGGLVGYWRFDEGRGGEVQDQTLFGQSLTFPMAVSSQPAWTQGAPALYYPQALLTSTTAGLPKVFPDSPTSPQSPAVSVTQWKVNATDPAQLGPNLLQNSGNEANELAGWSGRGWWSHGGTVIVMPPSQRPSPYRGSYYFLPVSNASPTDLAQTIYVFDDNREGVIVAGAQEFVFSGYVRSRAGGTVPQGGGIRIEFLDYDLRSQQYVVLASFQPVASGAISHGWQHFTARRTAPSATQYVRVTLLRADDLAFDELALRPVEPSNFYEFTLRLVDPQRETRYDAIGQRLTARTALDLDSFSFWEQRAASGPVWWQLRSSLDNFGSVIASGWTGSGLNSWHTVTLGPSFSSLAPSDTPVTFRLYGFSSTNGAWTVDNVALRGHLARANQLPVAPVVRATTSATQPVTVDLVGACSDADRDPLTLISVRGQSFQTPGTITNNGNGTVTYLSEPAFTGNVTFDYQVSDGRATVAGQLVIQVTPVPVAKVDAYSVDQGGTLDVPAALGLLANDDRRGGTVLQVNQPSTIFGSGPGTLLFVNSDGSFRYLADANLTGSFQFTYRAVNSLGLSGTATVTILVRPTVARDDAAVAVAGTPVTVPVLNNDDPLGRTTLVSVTKPRYGQAVLSGSAVRYTPPAVLTQGRLEDTFNYTMYGPGGVQRTARVTMLVVPPETKIDVSSEFTFTGNLTLSGKTRSLAGAQSYQVTSAARLTASDLVFDATANVINQGTITLDGSSLTVNFTGANLAFANEGTVDLQAGGVLKVAQGQFINRGLGQIKGIGVIQVPDFGLTNEAWLGPEGSSGQLTVDGDFNQEPSGELEIEIRGRAAGSGYEQLKVTGKATLGGKLTVKVPATFTPRAGDRFEVLTAATRSSEFALFEGLKIKDGLFFEVIYTNTAVQLLVHSVRLESAPTAPEGSDLGLVWKLDAPLAQAATAVIHWGDQSAAERIAVPSDATQVSAHHTYHDQGQYLASLDLEFASGWSAAAVLQRRVTVVNESPRIVALTGDRDVVRDSPAVFRATALDPGEDRITYRWDFGDGSEPLAGVDLVEVAHPFTKPGLYAVSLTVSDGEGGFDTRSLGVTVRSAEAERSSILATLSLGPPSFTGQSAGFDLRLAIEYAPAGATLTAFQLNLAGTHPLLTNGGADFSRVQFELDKAVLSGWTELDVLGANDATPGFGRYGAETATAKALPLEANRSYHLGRMRVDLAGLESGAVLFLTLAADTTQPTDLAGKVGETAFWFAQVPVGVDPGVLQFAEPGGVTFTVPSFALLTVEVNQGLRLSEGSASVITRDVLFAKVGDREAWHVRYSLTKLPAHGQLLLRGAAMPLGAAFTQQDINDGVVSYLHDGSETTADEIGLLVATDETTTTQPLSFALTIEPVNTPPTLRIVSSVAGARQATPFTITYKMLTAALETRDPEDAPIHFRIERVVAGTLTKGGTPVVPGQTLVGSGDTLVWIPPGDRAGVLDAFEVRAWDGALASDAATTLRVDVAPIPPPLLIARGQEGPAPHDQVLMPPPPPTARGIDWSGPVASEARALGTYVRQARTSSVPSGSWGRLSEGLRRCCPCLHYWIEL